MKRDDRASPKAKCLVLRLFRLKHLPPAYNATSILHESGLPVLLIEFGNLHETTRFVAKPLPTWRLASRWSVALRKLQPVGAFADTFFRLAWLFVTGGRPRLIIAHGMQEQCLAWLLSVVFRVPVIVHVHEIYALSELDRFNRFFFRWGLLTLKRAALLLFPESDRARLYRTLYGVKTRHEIVYNAPRLHTTDARPSIRDELMKARSIPSGALLMAYMGGIGKMHAFEEVFLAMVETPTVHFLIWGWGDDVYLKELKDQAMAFTVADRVHFMGKTDERKWSELASCDVAYCVYKPEVLRLKHAATASNKLMEAMAAALPVITSDSPDFKDLVYRLDIGLCADPSSSSALAGVLKAMIADPARRRRMARNALQAHQREYYFEHQFSHARDLILDFFPDRQAKPSPPQSDATSTASRAVARSELSSMAKI